MASLSREIQCSRIKAICPHGISSKKTCFIMMAYNESYSSAIEGMLKKAVTKVLKLRPVLAKSSKIFGSTDLFCTRVCKLIMESTCCIADLTYNNTNVGIEIETAHGSDKPVIVTQYIPDRRKKIIRQEDKKTLKRLSKANLVQYSTLPLEVASDLAGLFYIRYKDQNDLIKQLRENMAVKS